MSEVRDLRIVNYKTENEFIKVVSAKRDIAADFYIDRRMYVTKRCNKFVLCERFSDMVMSDGYGIIIKRDRDEVRRILRLVDFSSYSNPTCAGGIIGLDKNSIIKAFEEHYYQKQNKSQPEG